MKPSPSANAIPSQTLVAALREPGAYPDRPKRIEVVETHFAWVFLTGRYAYKLRKPLLLEGADWRSLAGREAGCREELRLNQRLAEGTYLRVAPLARCNGQLAVDGPGETVDWLIVMRELDRAQMLDVRLRAGSLASHDLDRLVQALTRFYRSVEPERVAPPAYLESVRARIAEACGELARPEFGLPAEAIDRLARALEGSFGGVTAELAARAAQGRIIETHGDLRAEHVWLGEPLQVIDAMSFERRLRVLDTAEEVAMLAVDMTQLGFAAQARGFVGRYRAAMPDPASGAVVAFYESLRAATRAKVAIWHLDDASLIHDGERWRRRALEFVTLAMRAAAQATRA
jgi:aminoglycoside phosphotransferase family enzyme